MAVIRTAYILPTGDELRNGTVLDTDSPMLMQALLKLNNNCQICRRSVINDSAESIAEEIRFCAETEADLVILIGGSGSGHLHSDLLGKDYTHTGMESLLEHSTATSLYGKNGHMWSRLVCGYIGDTLVINVPGPYVEAKAAIEAFCATMDKDAVPDIKSLNCAMAQAVAACYEK